MRDPVEEEENGACIAEMDDAELPVILEDVDVMFTSTSPRRSVASGLDIVFLRQLIAMTKRDRKNVTVETEIRIIGVVVPISATAVKAEIRTRKRGGRAIRVMSAQDIICAKKDSRQSIYWKLIMLGQIMVNKSVVWV